MGRRMYSLEKNHNPVYFRFIALAAEKGRETAFPITREEATNMAEIILRMLREEYALGGEKQLRVILNIETANPGA